MIRLQRFSYRFAEQVLNSKLSLKQEIESILTDPSIEISKLSRPHFNKILEEKNCKVLGEFDCCGENLVEKAQEQREAMKSRLPPEESRKIEDDYLKYVKGHPNEKDLDNAKKFTREILNKI